MRILIHTQYYPPEMGAPQARLSDLARRLKDLGHEIQILTAFPNYPTGRIFDGYPRFYMNERENGICIHRSWILPSNKRSFFHRLVSYLSFSMSSLFVGLFKIPKVDIVFTESPPLFLAASGWLLARLKKARWVLNVSDLWPDSAKYIGMLSDRSLIYRVLEGIARFLYRRAWLVTGQSKEIVAEIEQQVPSVKSYHLSNGVDLTAFNPQKKSEEIRQRVLKNGEMGFVYAGLHGFFQGLDQILIAAEKLKAEPIRFVLVGDGPEKERLVVTSQVLDLKNVSFLPSIPHEEIPSLLASMDAAVISLKSSILGAVPSKIYEAMASGIPVLLVADGEAKEIVRQAGAGVAVPPGDAERLAAVVREMSSDPGWRRKMGQAGRIAVERLYDRAKIAEMFEALLLEEGHTSQGQCLTTRETAYVHH
jgi:colanic acid biosynthesis glycosyl transferase WcaI